jgi:hypothetical protein
MPKSNRRIVSLSLELTELSAALEGPRALADQLVGDALVDERQVRRTAHAIEAGLALTMARIDQLVRVVQQEADPRTILAIHNDVTSGALDHDITLPCWEAQAGLPRAGVKPGR